MFNLLLSKIISKNVLSIVALAALLISSLTFYPAPTVQADTSVLLESSDPSLSIATTASTSTQITPTVQRSTSNISLTRIEITPSSANMRVGETIQFTAKGYDDAGNEIGGLSFTWITNAGVIDESGVFFPDNPQNITGTVRAVYDSICGEAKVNISVFKDETFFYEPDFRKSGVDISKIATAEVTGSISGYVYQPDGVTPISNVLVSATRYYQTEVPYESFSTNTAQDGSYSLIVPPGTYRIRAYSSLPYAGEYYNNTYNQNESTPVTITSTENVSNINFILDLGGIISGHVYGEDGVTPVVNINVMANTTSVSGSYFESARTMADGSYSIVVCSGTYRVHIFGSSQYAGEYYDNTYYYDEAEPVTVTVPHSTSGIDFVLSPSGSISGHVYEDDGTTPLSNAIVWAKYEHDSFYRGYYTNSNGSYTAYGLRTGNYTVWAHANRYIDEYYNGVDAESEATPVSVLATHETTGINFSLELGGSISGIVTDDSGTPIFGAYIYASSFTLSDNNYTYTNSDGSYLVTGLPSDTYRVQANGNGYVREYYNNSYDYSQASPVPVTAPGETFGINFSLQLGGSISGVVRNSSGDPIAGAWLNANGDGVSCYGYSESMNDGSYTISGLLSGNYRVSAQASGFITKYYNNVYGSSGATLVPVTVPDNTSGIDFSLDIGGSISGVVRDDRDNPISGVYVYAGGFNLGSYNSARTENDGSYVITGLPSDTYRVYTSYSGYIWQYYDNSYSYSKTTPVPVIAPDQTKGIDFSLEPGGSISGFVRNSSGSPIADVYVYASGDGISNSGYSRSASDGSYTIFGLLSGNYRVYAQASGFITEYYNNVYGSSGATLVPVTVPNDTADIDFSLDIGGSISGVVRNSSGGPIADAYIFVSGDGISSSGSIHSANDGSYTISGLLSGNYRVYAQASGFITEYYNNVYSWNEATLVPVTIPDNTSGIDFSLDIGGSISGVVRNISGNPIADAYLYASGDGVSNSGSIRSTNDGSYTISGLLSGNYRVYAQPSGFITEYYNNVYSWSGATLVPVTVPDNTSGIDFSLDIGGSISGVVRNNSGEPIAGAYVYTSGDGISSSGSCNSASDGSYFISGLLSGNYRVYAQASGFITEYYNNVDNSSQATLVSVTVPDNTSGIDFSLESGSISGVVRNSSGNPIAGAYVYASCNGTWGGGYSRSASDGSYSIIGLSSGIYRVYARASGFVTEYYNDVNNWSNSTLIPVKVPDNTPNINFSLLPTIDSFADLGNPEDEASHNLSGWGSEQGPPDNTFISPSGDQTKRFMTLRGDNSLELGVAETGIPYLLIAEVEDSYCTDNFQVFVNGRGPLYEYIVKDTGDITVVRHQAIIPPDYITAASVNVVFRNTSTDDCGLAAVYNVRLQALPPLAAGDEAEFVYDVTIPDGTRVEPLQPFVKTWRLRNTGTTTWDTRYKLVFETGDRLGDLTEVNLSSTVPPGSTIDIPVSMVAPSSGGVKKSYWRLQNPTGLKFGDTVWTEVSVAFTPGPELLAAIDSIVDESLYYLQELQDKAQEVAELGDYFQEQVAKQQVALAFDLTLGFANIFGDIRDIKRLHDGIQMALPGMEASWNDIMNLKQNYKDAGFLFDTTLREALKTESFEGLGPKILTGGLKYYAAKFRDLVIENMSEYAVKESWSELANTVDCFSEILYPSLSNAISLARADLLSRKTELLENFPALSPEQEAAYSLDLEARTDFGNRMVSRFEYEKSLLNNIQGFHEGSLWEKALLSVLKFVAKTAAGATFDGPGKLLVDSFVTSFASYADSFKLIEAGRMVTLAQGLMVEGVEISKQMELNAGRALDFIRSGSNLPPPVTAEITATTHVSEGTQSSWDWLPWNEKWNETGSYTLVNVMNTSAEEATFLVFAQYGTPYPGIYGVTFPAPETAEEVIVLQPGETGQVRLQYKNGSKGGTPVSDSIIFIYLLGNNGYGTYYLSGQSTIWTPQLVVTQSSSSSIATAEITDININPDDIVENPVDVFITASLDTITYEGQIWVTNPMDLTVSANITQQLPLDCPVTDTGGAVIIDDGTLYWQEIIEPESLLCLQYGFEYVGDLSSNITIPGASVIFTSLQGEPVARLSSEKYELEPSLPITIDVQTPVEILPENTANVTVLMNNLLDDNDIEGTITITVIAPDETITYKENQPFLMEASSNMTMEFVITPLSTKGFYLVKTELTYDDVTRTISNDIMRVGILGPDISLIADPEDFISAGDNLTYKIELTNTTGINLTDIVVEASIPPSSSIVPGSINESGQADGAIVRWQIPELSDSINKELIYQVNINPDAVQSDNISLLRCQACVICDQSMMNESPHVQTIVYGVPDVVFGEINGRVTVQGLAVPAGVLVNVNGEYSTTTNPEGFYSIQIPEGIYKLGFYRAGCVPFQSDDVIVTADSTITLPDVHLIKGDSTPTVEVNSGNTISLVQGGNRNDISLTIRKIPTPGLGAFTFYLSWNKDVIHVDSIIPAPVDGFFIDDGEPDNSIGTATITGFSLGSEYPSGNVTVASMNVTAVGNAGDSTLLGLNISTLSDETGADISAMAIGATVNVINLVAETNISQVKDADGIIVISMNVTRIKDPATGLAESIPGGIGSFTTSATATLESAGMQFLDIRPFGIVPDAITGVFSGVLSPPINPPGILAKLVSILSGNCTTPYTLTVSVQDIVAAGDPGIHVWEEYPNSILFLRGDASNNGKVDILDAMYIAQYIVKKKTIEQINALNAASVKHDTGGDKIDILDAMYIAQYIVKKRDAYFSLK